MKKITLLCFITCLSFFKGADDRSRIEPVYRLVNYYRRQGDFNTAYELAHSYHETSSADLLFIESWMKNYAFPVELGFYALHLGKYTEAHLIYDDLLKKENLPLETEEHILYNLVFLEGKTTDSFY